MLLTHVDVCVCVCVQPMRCPPVCRTLVSICALVLLHHDCPVDYISADPINVPLVGAGVHTEWSALLLAAINVLDCSVRARLPPPATICIHCWTLWWWWWWCVNHCDITVCCLHAELAVPCDLPTEVMGVTADRVQNVIFSWMYTDNGYCGAGWFMSWQYCLLTAFSYTVPNKGLVDVFIYYVLLFWTWKNKNVWKILVRISVLTVIISVLVF